MESRALAVEGVDTVEREDMQVHVSCGARRHVRLRARIACMYSDTVQTIDCDRVVCEHGTVANDDLYHALRPHSRNLGEIDIARLARFEPPAPQRNNQGRFVLLRIGDAWASRNVHAAMLDAMRMCKDL